MKDDLITDLQQETKILSASINRLTQTGRAAQTRRTHE